MVLNNVSYPIDILLGIIYDTKTSDLVWFSSKGMEFIMKAKDNISDHPKLDPV